MRNAAWRPRLPSSHPSCRDDGSSRAGRGGRHCGARGGTAGGTCCGLAAGGWLHLVSLGCAVGGWESRSFACIRRSQKKAPPVRHRRGKVVGQRSEPSRRGQRHGDDANGGDGEGVNVGGGIHDRAGKEDSARAIVKPAAETAGFEQEGREDREDNLTN